MKDPDAWLLDQLNHNELKHERGSLIDFQYLSKPFQLKKKVVSFLCLYLIIESRMTRFVSFRLVVPSLAICQ